MNYILSIDQGTSSTRTIIFDKEGNMLSISQKEHQQIYPKPSWVEHDANEIRTNVLFTMHEAVKKAKIQWKEIKAIGITNQRETVVAWDKKTGNPVSNAIVWQCRRTSPLIDNLKKDGYAELFSDKTGLVLDAYFSGTKIRWMIDNIDKVNSENVVFGTIDAWIIYFLGGEHATDASNASRTLLFDLHRMKYSEELSEILKVPINRLPIVKENASAEFGYYNVDGVSIPIRGVLGDQQAALFGQTGFSKGDIKTTYGTGNFSLLNTGDSPTKSNNGLLTTVGWQFGSKTTYALEGSVFVTGASIRWLRDGIGIIKDYSELDPLINEEKNSGGVYFVPAFVGLGAPHWDSSASGSFFGISGGTNKSHIIHATLDAIAFQTEELFNVMSKDATIEITEMKVDGGATKSKQLMRKQANISQIDIIIPKNVETTALGAAMMAGLGILWKDLDALKQINPFSEKYSPDMSEDKLSKKYWEKAVEKSKSWY